MILNNFLYRVRDWVTQNRSRLIKYLLILAAVIVAAWLMSYAFERYHAWRYEKSVEALDKRFQDADAEAKSHKALADALKIELELKDAKIVELGKQASAAKVIHERTKTVYLTQKEEYEQIRNNPLPVATVTCADLRAELAGLGLAGR